jgi:protein-serine/threonine kinase
MLPFTDILLTTSTFLSPLSTPGHQPPIQTSLVKLTDFGLSRFIDLSHPRLTTRCGSEAYAAPELVIGSSLNDGAGWQGYDGRETDAWALGVVIYGLICRGLPFGEGPGVVGGETRGMRGEVKAGERRGEEREARRHWLMRIAKGEWTWPEGDPTPVLELGQGQGNEELVGAKLKESVGVKRVVEKLLVRDPTKRAKVGELWEDEWVRGECEKDECGNGDEDGWLVDKEEIDSVACQEVV